mmetsp:Transcript_120/g.143  ORF Transcript_120/g.143 Transcript_120/m.143 type:complete len:143 (-) Transcript_120:29-457(-)
MDTDEWCLDAVECGDGASDESSGTDETDIEESDEEEDNDDVVVEDDDDDDNGDDSPPFLLSKNNKTVVVPVAATHIDIDIDIDMDLAHHRLGVTDDYSSLSLPHDQINIKLSCAQLQQHTYTVGGEQLQEPEQTKTVDLSRK